MVWVLVYKGHDINSYFKAAGLLVLINAKSSMKYVAAAQMLNLFYMSILYICRVPLYERNSKQGSCSRIAV